MEPTCPRASRGSRRRPFRSLRISLRRHHQHTERGKRRRHDNHRRDGVYRQLHFGRRFVVSLRRAVSRANYNPETGTLTITGGGTAATYQSALQSVKYQTTSQNPAPGIKTVTFQVIDSNAICQRHGFAEDLRHSRSTTHRRSRQAGTSAPTKTIPASRFIGWATNISAGPGEEQSTQTPDIEIVSLSNPGLFCVAAVRQRGRHPEVYLGGKRDREQQRPGAGHATTAERPTSASISVPRNRSRSRSTRSTTLRSPSRTRSWSPKTPFSTSSLPGVLGNDRDLEANPMTAIKLTDPLHGCGHVQRRTARSPIRHTPTLPAPIRSLTAHRTGLLQSVPDHDYTFGRAGERRPSRGRTTRPSPTGLPVTIPVTANDTDIDGDILRVTYVYATDSRLPHAGWATPWSTRRSPARLAPTRSTT